jgi:hypothetical protein
LEAQDKGAGGDIDGGAGDGGEARGVVPGRAEVAGEGDDGASGEGGVVAEEEGVLVARVGGRCPEEGEGGEDRAPGLDSRGAALIRCGPTSGVGGGGFLVPGERGLGCLDRRCVV